MPCLDDDLILRFVAGRVTSEERALAEEHLNACANCRVLVAEAARSEFEPVGSGDPPAIDVSPGRRGAAHPPLAAGTMISHFEILSPLGAGAAGVVYRARDVRLDRHVALKMLPAGDSSADRLLDEARAMARLSHPNVVNVHDVGVYQDEVFLVMELVEGRTLGDWLRERERSWREIVAVFLEAGRGLEAAHAAGIVHRDFKPDNVLIGTDGRVRVTDFGLALGAGRRSSARGGIAGTPAYMAPEQFVGKDVDARSDQFSFCAAFYRALYGQHPFVANTDPDQPLLALANQVVAGRLRPPPGPTRAPRWLFDLLERGLAADAAARFPSVQALLFELERRLGRRGRLARGLIALGAAGAVAAVVIASRLAVPQARCGNGVVEATEECDDGNASDSDGCLPDCRFARCGDGHVRAHVEECDDGNQRDGDGCSAGCLACQGQAALAEGGRCYLVHDRPATFAEARAACEAEHGDLAVYTSKAGCASVQLGLLRGVSAPIWVGLHGRKDGGFEWVSGEPVSSTWSTWIGPYGWSMWPGPPPADMRGKCVWQTPAPPSARPPPGDPVGGVWQARPCDDRAGALCEKVPWSVRSRDNHAFHVELAPLTWQLARQRCASLGGHLATIADADENAFVAAMNGALDVWLGASDAGDRTGRFSWVTGEPLGFRAFGGYEPDLPNLGGRCAVMGADKRWHDRECAEQQAYVCEVD